MSRGFVKEDDQEEAPFIPPRAPLPDGVVNHVTPRGLQLLMQERESLEAQRGKVLEGVHDEQIRRRELAVINGRLELLNERIASARVVDPAPTPKEVRFGTTVTFTYQNGPQQGTERTFTLVGVDESDVKEGRIAFTAPIARALLGKKKGQVVQFQLAAGVQKLKVLSIH